MMGVGVYGMMRHGGMGKRSSFMRSYFFRKWARFGEKRIGVWTGISSDVGFLHVGQSATQVIPLIRRRSVMVFRFVRSHGGRFVHVTRGKGRVDVIPLTRRQGIDVVGTMTRDVALWDKIRSF